MGLDINFYRQNKSDHDDYDEVGYFRKVNFLLTYFDVHENDNCTDIPITKDQIESLAQDTNAELIHKNLDVDNKEPLNESLRTKKVFFGYWGQGEAGEEANYQITYTFKKSTKSDYGFILTGMRIKRI